MSKKWKLRNETKKSMIVLCSKTYSDLKRTDVLEVNKPLFCLNLKMLNFNPINLN